jgi:hypothetical protein
VAHAYNPSYSGGRDQEDRGSKPTWANRLWNPILIKPITHTHKKSTGGVAQNVGPEFKRQYHHQKKKKKKKKKKGKKKPR